MWFLLGTLVGADIEPRLRRIQLQLDNLETALNLAMVTRAPKPPFAA
jgi:hypothetical protein